MTGGGRLLVLGVIMLCIATAGTVISLTLLYDAAFEQQRARLDEMVHGHARLMNALARSPIAHPGPDPSDHALTGVLRLVRDARKDFAGLGETGEFTLARREGDRIVFLLAWRHGSAKQAEPIAMDSGLAQPMRLALRRQEGTLIGRDYRGAVVLAAYCPVEELGLGVVAKIDLAEIRAPFVRAGLWSLGASLVLVLVGGVLFGFIGMPLIHSVRASARRFEGIFESSSDLQLLVDRTGAILEANAAACATLDHARSDLLVLRFGDLLAPGQLEVRRALSLALELESRPVLEATLRRENGDPLSVEIRVSPLTESQDDAALLTMIDVTERLRAQRAQRDSEQGFRAIADTVPEAIVMSDMRGLISYWNLGAERIFGHPAREVMGREVSEMLIPERLRETSRREMALAARATREGVTGQTVNLTGIRAGGKEFPAELAVARLRVKGQRQFLAIIRDVSKREVLERELVHAQKMDSIGKLAAGIAHEINTPCQFVSDNTHFLDEAFTDLGRLLEICGRLLSAAREGEVPPDLVQEAATAWEEADVEFVAAELPQAIQQSREGLDRISTIVRAMKEFSHPGSDDVEHVDLNSAILSTITVARNEWKYAADLEPDLDESLPTVPCYLGDINQVVLNLIVNAAHAITEALPERSGEKGRIGVSTRLGDGCAEIRIADSGTGIPEDARSRIFDPFFTTKEVGRGTGQGLAIAHAVVVEKHGGEISFESEMGRGTTLLIRLPLDPAGKGSRATEARTEMVAER